MYNFIITITRSNYRPSLYNLIDKRQKQTTTGFMNIPLTSIVFSVIPVHFLFDSYIPPIYSYHRCGLFEH